jgi:hypothetical protein
MSKMVSLGTTLRKTHNTDFSRPENADQRAGAAAPEADFSTTPLTD